MKLRKTQFGLSVILSLSPRDEYGNTYPPHEGEYSILTLPLRESMIHTYPPKEGEYGNTYPLPEGEYFYTHTESASLRGQ